MAVDERGGRAIPNEPVPPEDYDGPWDLEPADDPVEPSSKHPRPTDEAPQLNAGDGDGEGDGAGGARKSQATQLVELAEQLFRFGVTDAGEPYAVERGGPNLTRPFRGRRSLGSALAEAYYDSTGRAPTAAARTDALAVLDGKATRMDPHEPALRVGRDDTGAIVIDRGTPDGAAVRLADGTYELLDRSPVLFARSSLVGPLPAPGALGTPADLDRLRDHLNVTDTAWPLLVGWLVAGLIPDIPHAVLALVGQQGTAKTTTARRLGALIDPSPAPVRSAPRTEDQWAIQAAGSWVVALDNISGFTQWFSDVLCKASTGDAHVRRTLYTDSDQTVLTFRRVVIVTSIDPGAMRADLAERLLPVELERIPADHRRSEADLDAAFNRDHPRILAGLYALAAEVIEVLPTVTLDTMPRMADFARVLAAIDRIRGTDTLPGYLGALDRLSADVVEADAVAGAIVELIETGSPWEGSAADLLAAIVTEERERLKGWPATPRGLTAELNRCAPALRALGITLDQLPRTNRARRWRIEITPNQPSQPSQPSPAPQTQRSTGDGTARSTVTPSPQPSPPEPHNHADRDGSDGSDGHEHNTSADDLCRACGNAPAGSFSDLCVDCSSEVDQ